ncbi:MAG: glycerol-3-phosphate 1-O-acyltransferase PlsY [Lachnospiraceae bacterium]|nr:glycerol-3-phosphate 1-O-acyltransferase PlsY [Lachnospiraceae bacterium]
MERVICLGIGYLFGIFQTAYIYGKLNGIDIREYGSGNAGTTNALRVLGKKAGLTVFLGDVAKTVLAVLAVRFLFGRRYGEILPLLGLYAGTGVILGHNFPIQLGFKGGKGIACTAGLAVTLGPIVTIVEAGTFLLSVILSRYVSVGSILVVIEMVVLLVVLGENGYYGMSQGQRMEFYLISVVLACMAIYRHRGNIRRLISGTESKVFRKKSE